MPDGAFLWKVVYFLSLEQSVLLEESFLLVHPASAVQFRDVMSPKKSSPSRAESQDFLTEPSPSLAH